LIVIFVFLDY